MNKRTRVARKPDFFIVGAPKAGTTALRSLLQCYGDVYLPSPEEPNYFCNDINTKAQTQDEQWYLRQYFPASTDSYRLIGEKSTWYMYSKTAAARIAAFQPNAKIIIMLRNPVDLVYSFHSQMLYVGLENEPDFARAWMLQSERKTGKALPPRCSAPKLLQYSDVGCLGDQLERFLDIFPKEQLFIRTIEDIQSSHKFIQDLEVFLEIPESGRRYIPRQNEARSVRFQWLDALLRPPQWLERVSNDMKSAMGVRRLGLGLTLRWIREKINTRKSPRTDLPLQLRKELADYFYPQIVKLEDLAGRDLSEWIEK